MRFIALSNFVRKTSLRLLTLLCGCGMAGWVLISYKASFAIWVIIEAIVLYLAWAGVGAIAGSTVCVLGVLWMATLFHREAVFLVWSGTFLTSAQDWAIELLLNWFLATVLAIKLAFTQQFLRSNGWNRTKTVCWLAIVANLGFSLGQGSKVLLP